MGKKVAKKKKLKWWHIVIVVVILLVIFPGGKDNESEISPTPEPTATMTPTLEPTETPKPTDTPIPTATNTPKPTPTNSPAPTNTPKPTSASDTSVLLDKIIGNVNTNKYHTTNCGRLPDEENRIYFDTVEDAEAQGMVECGYCIKKRE